MSIGIENEKVNPESTLVNHLAKSQLCTFSCTFCWFSFTNGFLWTFECLPWSLPLH